MLIGIKGYKIFLPIVLLFLVFPLNINATQRVWPGIINDTVRISDTTIIDNEPLTLPPGTHLIFTKNSTLLAKVPVKAIGTYDNPITFNIGGGGTSPDWNSFSIECQSTDSVVFKCCQFEYGDNPLIINRIRNAYIQDCFFYKVNTIGITCNKLSNKLVVENCFFYGLYSLPIIKLSEADSGASAFINKNFIKTGSKSGITSDTVGNIYYSGNYYGYQESYLTYESGIGPHFSTSYYKHDGLAISNEDYNFNNVINGISVSKTVSIDGRVLTGQTSSRLIVLNKTQKKISGNNFGKSFH